MDELNFHNPGQSRVELSNLEWYYYHKIPHHHYHHHSMFLYNIELSIHIATIQGRAE